MNDHVKTARGGAVGPLWWAIEGRGVLALLFGFLALIWPGITLGVLVALFGVYALVDGVVSIMAMFATRRWLLYLVLGISGIAAGILTFLYPEITLLALVYIVGAWAIVTGAFQIATAVTQPELLRSHRWLWGISGALAVGFGVLLFAMPGVGMISRVYIVAFYALMYGIAQILLGFNLRQIEQLAQEVIS